MNAPIDARNLSGQAPHSPRGRVGGFVIAGRAIDKRRSSMAGTPGQYHYDCPLDNVLFTFKGINGTPKTPAEIKTWSDETEAGSMMNNPEKRAYFIENCTKLGLKPETSTTFDGPAGPDPDEIALESASESERWDPLPGSTGYNSPSAPGEDEDEEGKSDNEKLDEKKGIEGAEHDQMRQAAKESAKNGFVIKDTRPFATLEGNENEQTPCKKTIKSAVMKHNKNHDNAPTGNPQLVPVRFEFTDTLAHSVSIAGTFNHWQPETKALHASGSGRWYKDTVLAPGTYEYCLIVDGHWMPDPHAKETVSNPFGGRNSILKVSAEQASPVADI